METINSQLRGLGLKNAPCPKRTNGWKHNWKEQTNHSYICGFCGERREFLMWTSRGQRIRNILLQRDGDLCWLCDLAFTDDDPATIEHVVPRAEGGLDRMENYKLTHYSCNWQRGKEHPLNGKHYKKEKVS